MKKGFVVFFVISYLLVITPFKVQAVYEKYITTLPQPAAITQQTQDIQQELEKKVRELVTAGHMTPSYYQAGIGHNPTLLYATPNETFYTLSVAYPYLSSQLKTQVKTYLQNEITKYNPITTGYYQPNCCKLSDQPGTRREYGPINPNEGINFWPGVPVHSSVLYAIWAYSYYTNDWSYATASYTSIKSLYSSLKSKGIVKSYPELAGVIGFARIAKQLNNIADYNDALAFAESGFAAGVNFDQFATTATTNYPVQAHQYISPVFFFQNGQVYALHFNRDLARFLKDTASLAVTSYASQLLKDIPYGFLTGSAMSHGENAYTTPDIPWTYFMLRVSLGDSTTQLKKLLDEPDRKGDLFYMQELVATIESATDGTADQNTDSKINTIDTTYMIKNLNSTTYSKGDLNGDGIVDASDIVLLFRSW